MNYVMSKTRAEQEFYLTHGQCLGRHDQNDE